MERLLESIDNDKPLWKSDEHFIKACNESYQQGKAYECNKGFMDGVNDTSERFKSSAFRAKHDSELLDKAEERIKAKINEVFDEPNYQHDGETWQNGLVMSSDIVDEVITKLKAEVEE